MASIDEAYIDLTGTEKLHGPPLAAAHKLLTEITASTNLPCSGGLAATRLVAKIASEQAKPRGLVWVPAVRKGNSLRRSPSGGSRDRKSYRRGIEDYRDRNHRAVAKSL